LQSRVSPQVPRVPEKVPEHLRQGEIRAEPVPFFFPGISRTDHSASCEPRNLPVDAFDVAAGCPRDEARMEGIVRVVEEDGERHVKRFRSEKFLDHIELLNCKKGANNPRVTSQME